MTEQLSNDKTGVVVWFDSRRGYGYIARDNGEKDIFVHWTNIEMNGFKTLKQGQKVCFELGANKVGQQAEQVRILAEPEENE